MDDLKMPDQVIYVRQIDKYSKDYGPTKQNIKELQMDFSNKCQAWHTGEDYMKLMAFIKMCSLAKEGKDLQVIEHKQLM